MTAPDSGLGQAPLFSVVVPTHNRADVLLRVLRAWEAQQPTDLPFELLLVDDGSHDDTATLCADYRPQRYQLNVERQAAAGPAQARNRALKRARGRWVLFAGDDIEPTPTLLAEHRRAHDELADERVAVLGRIAWPADLRLTATMRHIDGPGAQQFSYHYLQDGVEYDFRHFYTSNISLGRELLAREPAGFSTAFRYAAFEDAELSWRLSRHGMRIVYRALPLAFHHHHHDLRSFLERQRRCGAMAEVLVRLHPQVAPLIGSGELRRMVWRERLAGWTRRRRRTRLAEQREPLLAALLAFLAPYDDADAVRLPTVLHPLFRYGFFAGLAEQTLAAGLRDRVLGGVLLDTLVPAFRHFLGELQLDGAPVPVAALAGVRPLLEV